MRKAILILVWLFFICNAYAQEDSLKTIELDQIVIQENRLEMPFSQASRSIVIVTKRQIEQMPAQNFTEILKYIPGMDIRQRGPAGVQADISMRGGSFDQTLVLLNGIKLSDPQTGHHLLNVPVNKENIDRIEVLKGPGARIYGQNAFSGAVNIITKTSDIKSLSSNVYIGDFGAVGAGIVLSLPFDNYQQTISFATDASSGYRPNTEYLMANSFYQSQLKLKSGQLNIIGGYSIKDFGAYRFYTTSFDDEKEKTKTSLASIGLEHMAGKWVIKPRIYYRGHIDDFSIGSINYSNHHETDVMGAEINSSYHSSLGSTGMGVEYRKEMIKSTNLGNHKRDNIGLFLEHQFAFFDKVMINPGIYVNYYSDYSWNYFPGVDLGLKFSKGLLLFANFGKSYRIPTYTNLYYEGPDNTYNSELQPEEAFTHEYGFRFVKKRNLLNLSYFNQYSTNLIEYVRTLKRDAEGQLLPLPEQDPFKPINFLEARIRGVEISWNYNVPTQHQVFLNHLQISYNYLNSDLLKLKTENDMVSKYAMDNLRHQLMIGINHKVFIRNITHDFRLRFVERNQMDNYILIDSRLQWMTSRKMNIYGELTNLTNVKYRELSNEMPGRWVRIGLNYTLNL